MIKSQRWFVVGLLFLAGVVNYLDRAALSIAAPLIQKDLHFTHAQMGVVFSSFFIGYALFNFVGGVLSDKIGAKKVFGGAMGIWSLFCGATALASSLVSLIVLRVLFGMGEGPFSSSNSKIVNNWFPRREVASAIGVISSGTPLGGALAGPIVGYMAIEFGWRWAFVVIMLIGLAWLVLWALTTTEHPQDNARVSKAELGLIVAGQQEAASMEQGAHGKKAGLRFYLRQPIILATAFAFFAYNYVLFFFLSWFPTYLTEAHHMSLRDMSIATVIHRCDLAHDRQAVAVAPSGAVDMSRHGRAVRRVRGPSEDHRRRGCADVRVDFLPVRHWIRVLGRDSGYGAPRERRGCGRVRASSRKSRGRDRAGGDGVHCRGDAWRVWRRVRAGGRRRGAGRAVRLRLDS
jgi:MFS family permease